jgi:hypothetical protein
VDQYIYIYNHTSVLVNRQREGKAKVKSAGVWGEVGPLRDFNNTDSMQNALKEAAHIRNVRTGPFV